MVAAHQFGFGEFLQSFWNILANFLDLFTQVFGLLSEDFQFFMLLSKEVGVGEMEYPGDFED